MPAPVDFAIEHEGWNSYQLADGSRLRTRVVLRAVRRRDELDQQGKPVYDLDYALMSEAEAPEQFVAAET